MKKFFMGIALFLLGGSIVWLSADLLNPQIIQNDQKQQMLIIQIEDLKRRVSQLEQQILQLLEVIQLVDDEKLVIKYKYVYIGENNYENAAYFHDESKEKAKASKSIWVAK